MFLCTSTVGVKKNFDISSNSLISESTRQSARRESPLEDGPSGGFRVQVANDQAVQHTSQHIQIDNVVPPSYVRWFINLINYILEVRSIINHNYWSYKPT